MSPWEITEALEMLSLTHSCWESYWTTGCKKKYRRNFSLLESFPILEIEYPWAFHGKELIIYFSLLMSLESAQVGHKSSSKEEEGSDFSYYPQCGFGQLVVLLEMPGSTWSLEKGPRDIQNYQSFRDSMIQGGAVQYNVCHNRSFKFSRGYIKKKQSKIDGQWKFDAWSRVLNAGALGQPTGMG